MLDMIRLGWRAGIHCPPVVPHFELIVVFCIMECFLATWVHKLVNFAVTPEQAL
jgi:hypothetical protein